MRLWDALFFDSAPFKADPARSPTWNRGAYLVQGPGHCGGCHTPKNFLGGDQVKQALQGYSLQGWLAPNITNDPSRGLGSWSLEDLSQFLKSGHNRFAGAAGPMGEEVAHSSSQMTDADLAAIATYLKDVPGQAAPGKPLASDDPHMKVGAAIYQDLCAACHQKDGTGVPYLIPNLQAAASVTAHEPTSVLRVVIRGTQTVATDAEPTGPAMPAYGWQLNNEQIAAVTTYIRNSWGNAAPSIDAGEVHKARQELQARSD